MQERVSYFVNCVRLTHILFILSHKTQVENATTYFSEFMTIVLCCDG
jgi:hypothetical protein